MTIRPAIAPDGTGKHAPAGRPAADPALLAAALEYAARGMYIIPLHNVEPDGKCSCAGKRPNCADAGKHPRILDQYHNSSTDAGQIREWWDMWPRANVGCDLARSGLLAVDPDNPEYHAGKPGLTTWAALVERHGLQTRTPTSRTGSAGQHVLYRVPDGLVFQSVENALGLGVDTKSTGGLIVLPPSHNAHGQYTWIISPVECAFAEMPTALVYLLAKPPRPARPSNGHKPEPGSPYVQAVLRREVAAVSSAPSGERHATVYKAAAALGNFVGAGALDHAEVAEHLMGAAAQAGWDNEEKTLAAIEDGLTKGESQPREIPEPEPPPMPEPPPEFDGEHAAAVAPTGRHANSAMSEKSPARDGQLPAEADLTDVANGARLARRHADRLRFVGAWGWLAWDGRRWARDDADELDRYAKDTARSIYAEAFAADDPKRANGLGSWARTSLASHKLQAMIDMARSEPAISARPDRFDTDAMLLNVENGIIDLRSGELRPSDPSAQLTRLAPVEYHPDTRSALWDEFLLTVFDDNVGLIKFFQKAVGYSLTGDTSEQCWFLLHGSGANGKSTTLQTLLALFGDYGLQSDAGAFLAKRNDGPNNDIARLAGRRFVSAIEIGEGRRLAEVLVKQLTGGDTMSARFLHHEFFEFKPALKVWLAANHKPKITGTDYAIWRRVRFIPFTVTIPEDQRDPHLADKLQAELPGVLAWAVRGCLLWQQDGLQPPAIVTQATDAYRCEQDTLGAWLNECCAQEPDAWGASGALLESYRAYGGEARLSSRDFGMQLTERGFAQKRTRERGWAGLRLLDLTDAAKV